MASRVFTSRLGAGSSAAAGDLVLFTATDLWVWVLRDLILTSSNGSAQLLQAYITAGSIFRHLYLNNAFPSSSSVHLDLRQEILPSESLVVYGSLGEFDAIATGYKFEPAV